MAHQNVLDNDLQKITPEEHNQLQDFRLWIEQQPHLRARTDDQFLIQFLRYSKYNREEAQEKLDIFYGLKTEYPEMFAAHDVDDPKFREVHNLGCFTALPRPLSDNGPRLVVLNFNYNANKYNLEDIFLSTTAMLELMLLHDSHARTHGIVYIVDYAKASASHLRQFSPSVCKKLAVFVEKSLPIYLEHAYYINTSAAAQEFFKILFPLLTEDLRKRITIIGNDMKALAQYIPNEYLPADYGGQNSSCQEAAKEFNTSWDLYREYFKKNANFGSEDSLRAGNPLVSDDLSGISIE